MKIWAGAIVLAMALTGCSSARARPNNFKVTPVNAKDLVRMAKDQIGVPYRYGGESPKRGFDCSGLVWWCYQQLGSSIPRSARTQFELGRRVKSTELATGDLVFFDIGSSPPAHVGIITTPPNFVHAPSTGGKVRVDSLKNVYWSKHFYGARRIE